VIATYVHPRTTPYTFEEAAEAMRAALTAYLGGKPRDEVLALALAKSALETGRWRSIWCHNFGNQKAGPEYVGMFTCITLNEVLAGEVVWFTPEGQLRGTPGSAVVGQRWPVPPGHPQTRMRAYANRYDGAYAYVDFVSSQRRYTAAWHALLAGEPVTYVSELKRAGYFTADELPYRKAVVSLHREFLTKLRGQGWTPSEPDPDWSRLRRLVVAQRFDDIGIVRTEGMRELGVEIDHTEGGADVA
jgi:hypothetical protein